MEHRSSSLNSAGSDDTLSENGSFSSSALPLPPLPLSASSSDYLPNTDVPSLPTSSTTASSRPPSMLPTLFESKPIPPSASTPASSTGGYILTDQFDPLMVDSPDDTDSPDAHKLSAQEAAANSGYFPMPSMLDTGTASAAPPAIATTSTAQYTTATQQKQNGLQSTVAASTSGIKSEKAGGDASGGMTSDYVDAPSDLSSSSHSSTSATASATTSTSSSSSSKSTLASTSAAVAKKS
ncbi:MAG: hypothetical protein MJE68_10170, partial [Proteobacteria bacterium]|nr:hypothetical protein [Pseudomonadota bacterium]